MQWWGSRIWRSEIWFWSQHRIHSLERYSFEVIIHSLLEIFFTRPVGWGETFTLKIIRDTYNGFFHEQNHIHDAYVACASIGKAAVTMRGTTLHLALNITIYKSEGVTQSRVKSIDGLYLNISNGNFKLFHGAATIASATKEIYQIFLKVMHGVHVTFNYYNVRRQASFFFQFLSTLYIFYNLGYGFRVECSTE